MRSFVSFRLELLTQWAGMTGRLTKRSTYLQSLIDRYNRRIKLRVFIIIHLESLLHVRDLHLTTFSLGERKFGCFYRILFGRTLVLGSLFSLGLLFLVCALGYGWAAVWKLATESCESYDRTMHDWLKSLAGGVMEILGRVGLSEDSTRSIISGSCVVGGFAAFL